MTFISSSYDEDKVFYNYRLEDLTLLQTFLFSLWSFLVFALKLCKLLQTLTSSWLAQSLNKFQNLNPLKLTFHEHSSTLELIDHGSKPPKTPKVVKPRVQEILCENHGLLIPHFVDDFVVEHIFNQLHMDLSMLWHLHQVNKAWFKVVGKTLTWEVLKIVKFNNVFYYHTIVIQGLPRLSLQVRLNFN
jgi:hypothetical protein